MNAWDVGDRSIRADGDRSARALTSVTSAPGRFDHDFEEFDYGSRITIATTP